MTNKYHAEYNLRRYHERRREFLELLGNKCVRCDSTENLEFDHIDRATKTLNIGKLLNVSKRAALDELTKCQLLCKSCHKEKTNRESSVDHGGGLSGKKNCKCVPCKLKKAEYMSTYRRPGRASIV